MGRRIGSCDAGELKECLLLKFCLGPKFQGFVLSCFLQFHAKDISSIFWLPLHLCMESDDSVCLLNDGVGVRINVVTFSMYPGICDSVMVLL